VCGLANLLFLKQCAKGGHGVPAQPGADQGARGGQLLHPAAGRTGPAAGHPLAQLAALLQGASPAPPPGCPAERRPSVPAPGGSAAHPKPWPPPREPRPGPGLRLLLHALVRTTRFLQLPTNTHPLRATGCAAASSLSQGLR